MTSFLIQTIIKLFLHIYTVHVHPQGRWTGIRQSKVLIPQSIKKDECADHNKRDEGYSNYSDQMHSIRKKKNEKNGISSLKKRQFN